MSSLPFRTTVPDTRSPWNAPQKGGDEGIDTETVHRALSGGLRALSDEERAHPWLFYLALQGSPAENLPQPERFEACRRVLENAREGGWLWTLEMDAAMDKRFWTTTDHRPGSSTREKGRSLPDADELLGDVEAWLRKTDLAHHDGGRPLAAFTAPGLRKTLLKAGRNLAPEVVRAFMTKVDGPAIAADRIAQVASNEAIGEEAREAAGHQFLDLLEDERAGRQVSSKHYDAVRDALCRFMMGGLSPSLRARMREEDATDRFLFLDPYMSREEILEWVERHQDGTRNPSEALARACLSPALTRDDFEGLAERWKLDAPDMQRSLARRALTVEERNRRFKEKEAAPPPFRKATLSPEILESLAREARMDLELARDILTHEACTVEVARSLAQSTSMGEVRALLARNEAFRGDPEIRLILMKSRSLEVAEKLLADGRPEEFWTLFRRVARQDPERASRWIKEGLPEGVEARPEELTPLLCHGTPQVRERALLAMGQGQAKKPPEAEVDAARSLARSTSSGDTRALLARNKTFRCDPEIRRTLMKSRSIDVMEKLLADGRPEEFWALFRRIAEKNPRRASRWLEKGLPEGVEARPEELALLLSHSDPRVRERAVMAMGEAPEMESSAEAEPDRGVRKRPSP